MDPEGREWQVASIVRWRTGMKRDKKTDRFVPDGPYTIAHYVLRNTDGVEVKVTPPQMEVWSRESPDPLKGRRMVLNQEIHDGAKLIVLPAPGKNPVCPVRKGELYHLPSGGVLIDKITRKVVKSRSAEWHIEFTRILKERDYFMRRTPPNAGTPDDNKTDEEAGIESSYTGTASKSLDDLATVPPDFVERGRAKRELERQEARGAREQQIQAQAAKSRLNRLLANAKTPAEAERLLAGIVELCEQAEAEQKAA